MDPISAVAGLTGLSLQVFGAFQGQSAAKKSAEASQQIAKLEQQVEAQRMKAMEIDARRKNLENIRNAQRAQSLATATATNQGAQAGSGLQGGIAQIKGQEGFNALGINQNLEIGRTIFGINAQISEQKQNLAAAGSDLYAAQGLSSLGGSILGNASAVGRIGNTLPSLFKNA